MKGQLELFTEKHPSVLSWDNKKTQRMLSLPLEIKRKKDMLEKWPDGPAKWHDSRAQGEIRTREKSAVMKMIES